MPAGDIDLDQIKAAMKDARSVLGPLPGKRGADNKTAQRQLWRNPRMPRLKRVADAQAPIIDAFVKGADFAVGEMVECTHHTPAVIEPVADRPAAVKGPAATETVHVICDIVEIAVMNKPAEEALGEPGRRQVERPQRS